MKLTIGVLIAMVVLAPFNLYQWRSTGDNWYAIQFLVNLVSIGLLIDVMRMRREIRRLQDQQKDLEK